MTNNWLIYPNVTLGENTSIGDFVIIGEPAQGKRPGEIPTSIGYSAKIRSHTVIYAGNIIGDNLQTGHGVLVREENQIGDNVSLGSHSIIEHHINIGDGVRIHSNVFVPEYSLLEDGCWIGPGAILTNARYPRSKSVKESLQGPIVRSCAKIGAGAVLLPGITVGKDSLVGAGTVVVKDVPDGAVVVGNPGKIIRYVNDIDVYRNLLDSGQTIS
jgi:acetyltransferase-like isoleucine patch superfamily enzyme